MVKIDLNNKIQQARIYLMLKQPFFGFFLYKRLMLPNDKIDTAETDGTQIWYNPIFFEKLSYLEIAFVLAHEILHIAFQHIDRLSIKDHLRWNYATDYYINLELNKIGGFIMPKGGLLDKQYEGLSPDQIYDLLPKKPKVKGLALGGIIKKKKAINKSPYDDVTVSEEAIGLKDSQIDIKLEVFQALSTAKNLGKTPGNIERILEVFYRTRIDWQSILQEFMTCAMHSDYSWQKPNLRYLGTGFYLPCIIQKPSAKIVFVIDTSGSMTNDTISIALTSVVDILPIVKTEVLVIFCDSKIQSIIEFGEGDNVSILKPKGGGGTSFKPPFEYLSQNDIHPECLIYMTDLWGDFPDEAPSYPVLWMVTDPTKEPPYGSVLYPDFTDL